MSEKPENPPAFPHMHLNPGNNNMAMMGGMTLRDYFAAAALQGFLSSEICMRELDEASEELGITGAEEAEVQPKVVASRCYLLADAMLKARKS